MLNTNKLVLNEPLVGRLEVPVKVVSLIEFVPAASSSALKKSLLTRKEGESIPGTLLAISQGNVTFESMLGELVLPLASLSAYRFNRDDDAASVSAGEIGLVDGSILYGKVSLKDDKLVVATSLFGSLSVNWREVRYFIMPRNRVMWLAPPSGGKVELTGPVFPPPAPHWDLGEAEAGSRVFLKAIRLGARTVARFPLPDGQGKRTLQAALLPVLARQGEVSVKMDVAGQTLFRQTFRHGEEPKLLSLDLPAGDELVVTVDFGDALVFPCAVDLCDAYIMMKP